MEQPKFSIVDVFAEEKYAGNQLAVFRNVERLSDAEMQRIAKEMNYSETTFILSEREENGGYPVRIFTPAAEVPFAGHPTLGTAFIIYQDIIKKNVEKITLNLKVGQIPVSLKYKKGEPEILWMQQKAPVFGVKFDPAQIAAALSLSKDDLHTGFPIEEVSTGLPFIVCPLQSKDAVSRAQITNEKFSKQVQNSNAKAILIFARETNKKDNDLHVRVFAGFYGVPEDPATGSANGCLAGYLVKNRYFDSDHIDVRVEQGYEIGRPSLLHLKAKQTTEKIEIHVGGKVIPVAKGDWF